ncbi:hypothetical protein T4D_12167 [Trichinella pseudospiralis]|uniref:Uncharacterized protein n=1 Tax=Trichinella pseudospiralis TaxID=6337 RepID=A0A0V1FV47_TRIPS|nr:hypothetical protein T4D_12167 [Trichinella pseudospiralis]
MAIPTNQYVNMHIFLLSGFRQPVMFKARHFKLRSSCSLHVMFTTTSFYSSFHRQPLALTLHPTTTI